MPSKTQKCVSLLSSLILICLLVIMLTVVWVQFSQGAFRSDSYHRQKKNYYIALLNSDENDSRVVFTFKSTERPLEELQGGTPPSDSLTKHKDIAKSHLEELDAQEVELIKPLKISPELHNHDIMFNKMHNNDKPPMRHHSGHFRHKQAEVWDPHPHYIIQAFGKNISLFLSYNGDLAPNLHVSYGTENFTHKSINNKKLTGCFYSGTVENDTNSMVSVSLCNGMTGTIRTSTDTYFIEPYEKHEDPTLNTFLHCIKKIPHHSFQEKISNEVLDQNSTTNGILIDDDLQEYPLEGGMGRHHIINKRSISNGYRSNDFGFGQSDDENSSNEYHIKVLVVADATMAHYHKTKENLYHYILTLMSHASSLFKHATVGNAISVSVTQIRIQEDKRFTHINSGEMLRNFCDWHEKNIGRVRETNNVKHNVALLLTRDKICKNAQECDTLGVAEVASMCTSSSCAIVRDKGLSSSYPIAHEIGHVLGIPHDGDPRCHPFETNDQESLIMTRMMQNNTKPWKWSTCSRHFLTKFLSTNRVDCLNEPPEKDWINQISKVLPGEKFEVDKQCELEFGPTSTHCSTMPHCGSLWCTIYNDAGQQEGCTTQFMPWAEGTACSSHYIERGWCYQGECVNKNYLNPIPGGWSEWTKWGPCSRSCGGGIQKSTRECNNPVPQFLGAYCLGKKIRYRSCSTQPCENNANFRLQQCSEFNGDNKDIPNLPKDVVWVPKYGLGQDNVCQLHCRPAHITAHYLLREKVTDGTKCGLNSFDICVSGICLKGGCDNRIDSKLTLDTCGVCDGDNSTCEEVHGVYNYPSESGKYFTVVTIPKGSSNIIIEQGDYQNRRKPDLVYLALLDGTNNDTLLNGKNAINPYEQEIVFGSTILKYSGSNQTIEKITTPPNEKINKDIIVQILSIGNNAPPSITYRYTIGKNNSNKFYNPYPYYKEYSNNDYKNRWSENEKNSYYYKRHITNTEKTLYYDGNAGKTINGRYHWKVYGTNWSKCNSVCNGTQHIKPICVDVTQNTQVKNSFCSLQDMERFIKKQNCNTHCYLEWRPTQKDKCSSECGPGKRNIYHQCFRINSNSKENRVEDSQIQAIEEQHCGFLTEPSKVEDCEGPCLKTEWLYSEWSECSHVCGGGLQQRSAQCADANQQIIPDEHCANVHRITEQACNQNTCPTWTYTEWSICSATCGKGYQTRKSFCTVDGRIKNRSECYIFGEPFLQRECSATFECVTWQVDQWSPCSSKCGTGNQSRIVQCRNTEDNSFMSERHCLHILKPEEWRTCRTECKTDLYSTYKRLYYQNANNVDDNSVLIHNDNDDYVWATGKWTECSKACSKGHKSRLVACRNKLQQVDDFFCHNSEKPVNSVECNNFACPLWQTGGWSECDNYCKRHRLVRCQNHQGLKIDDEHCQQETKPEKSSKCEMSQCNLVNKVKIDVDRSKNVNANKSYRWKVGRWKSCTNKCGKGIRRRDVTCEDAINEYSVVDAFCGDLKKPNFTKPCERYQCNYAWIEQNWSSCSKTCGEGLKKRNVTCHKVYPGGHIDPNPISKHRFARVRKQDSFCDVYTKPPTTSRCKLSNCGDVYIWQRGPFNECSHKCGKKGRQTATITCIHAATGRKVQKRLCPKKLRPRRKRKCNQWRCMHRSCREIQHQKNTTRNSDYILQIGRKPALVYCYKMDTPNPEEFISLSSDGQNYAEVYDKRLKDVYSCPSSGQRFDTCDCLTVGPERSGLTKFWKVKLNITSLQIAGDDFTFSQQVRGKQIPYGTAGDCYSAARNCEQGRFSVDLSNTSFKLTKRVRWKSIGQYVSSQINRYERSVAGKCGGYCGECGPDPFIGLEVEIT